jgi:hypothetical protein
MKLFGSLSFSAKLPTEILRAIERERTMVVEREIREAEDDKALLRSLIRPEEDRGAASDPPGQASGQWTGLRQQLGSGSLPA